MSKHKMRLKDYICKPLIILVLIQVVILFFFLSAYNEDAYITLEDCHSDSIIVEEKQFIKGHSRIRGSLFYVVSGGESYTFSSTKYSDIDLDRLISIGEVIEIHYINSDDHFFGSRCKK